MRTGVTLDDVTRAADAILARGERPTVEAVRGFLGTGAPATVNTLLKGYYQALPQRLNLPAPVATAALQLYQSVKQAALVDVEQQEADNQAALKLSRGQLEAEKLAFEAEKTQLHWEVSGLTAELAALKEQLAAGQRHAVSLQGQLAEALREATSGQALAQASTEERERLVCKHQDEVEQLKARADGNERHLLTQIDDVRSQLKKLGAERDKDQAVAAQRIVDLEVRMGAQATDIADQRKEISRITAELVREQRLRSAKETELTTQAQAAAQELGLAKEQRTAALVERDTQRSVVDQLRKERDAALRDAALLRGRLETLLSLEQRNRPPITHLTLAD